MNEETLFEEALSRSPEERAAFLEQACEGRPELHAAVEALLAAHEKTGNILDGPQIDLAQTLVSGPGQTHPDATLDHTPGPVDASSAVTKTTDDQPKSEAGIVIAGRYSLQEKIGEGGMGEVWVAKQTEPVKRKVALKLIKTGMDSKAVLQRFEQERQALAMMEHPNIARVLDGGLTPTGQPFFVMEVVNGLPLTKFCDEARLTTKGRLELFVPICQAVQHAHQKGIVHRDLKPANILVTIIDGKPVPKVIDFGVAKATAGKLTDESMSTQFGAVVGTLEYMSPEQAGFSGEDIDTRADIYSLGVILYELLTGLRPVDVKWLKNAALSEMIRIIREEEPSKPSTRLSTDASLPTMAALRQTEPRKLMALLRGELDWMVMKCLEKHRERRYETANGLARDIQRYLADEAVEARPPSAWYRFRKLARRNRVALTTAGLVAGALVLGTAVATWQSVRATREAARATEAEARALAERDEKERARAEAVAARKKAEDFAAGLKETTALVGRAETHVQQGRWSSAHTAFTKAQELQPGVAEIYVFRRWMYEGLGLWDLAADDGAKVVALTGGAVWYSWHWHQYALLRLHVGDEKGYRDVCRQMLDRFGDGANNTDILNTVRACVLAPEPVIDPADLVRRAQHANAFEKANWKLYVEGLAHYRAGQYERALERLREAWSLDPNWPARAITYPALAMAYHRLGKADEARQALASAEKAIEGWTLAMVQGPVGAMPIPCFDWLECRHFYREAKQLLTRSPPPDDSRLLAIRERALAALSYGDAVPLLEEGRAHAARGEWDQAAVDYARALDLLPDDLSYFSPVSLLCADLVETPEVFARLVEHRPQDARLWVTRGRSHARRRQWGQAVADYAHVMESRPPDDGATFEYACLLLLSGDDAGYRRFCRRLVERYEQSIDAFPASNAIRVCGLAPGAVSDPARLVPWAEVWVERQPHTGWARDRLGIALYRAGRRDEAVRRFREAEEIHPSWPGLCVDDMFLALAHGRLGQIDEGRRWLEKANRWLAGADRDLAKEKTGFPPPIRPSDWLILQVLRREAYHVIADPGEVKNP